MSYVTISAMANKKHQSKKHTFKHSSPAESRAAVIPAGTTATATKQPLAATPRTLTFSNKRDFSYVNHDLKRVLIFAVSLIVLELALWLAMDKTGLGSVVYSLI